jgi:hypothetical protein
MQTINNPESNLPFSPTFCAICYSICYEDYCKYPPTALRNAEYEGNILSGSPNV